MSQRDQQDGRQERFMQPQRQRRQAQDTEFASEPGTFQQPHQQQQQQKKKQQEDHKTATTGLDNQ